MPSKTFHVPASPSMTAAKVSQPTPRTSPYSEELGLACWSVLGCTSYVGVVIVLHLLVRVDSRPEAGSSRKPRARFGGINLLGGARGAWHGCESRKPSLPAAGRSRPRWRAVRTASLRDETSSFRYPAIAC